MFLQEEEEAEESHEEQSEDVSRSTIFSFDGAVLNSSRPEQDLPSSSDADDIRKKYLRHRREQKETK